MMRRRLLVHLGTGKTGSSSIQAFLHRNAEVLRGFGVHYWGRNLESAFSPATYEWQRLGGTDALHRMDRSHAGRELEEAVLRAAESITEGVTAVWSNESILGRADLYRPLLHLLRDRLGIEVVPVAYVRNRRDFLRSAYVQWGIRHKDYSGRVQGFSAWTESRKQQLSFGRRVEDWTAAFPDAMRVFNYDAVGDVVPHFAGLLSSEARALVREGDAQVNRTPSERMLALHALHNNLSDGPVEPSRFEALLSRQPLLADGLQPGFVSLRELLPGAAELDLAEARLADDEAILQRILAAHGEPPLGSGSTPTQIEADRLAADLLSTLMRTVLAQDQIIEEQRRSIRGQVARIRHRPLWRRILLRLAGE